MLNRYTLVKAYRGFESLRLRQAGSETAPYCRNFRAYGARRPHHLPHQRGGIVVIHDQLQSGQLGTDIELARPVVVLVANEPRLQLEPEGLLQVGLSPPSAQ